MVVVINILHMSSGVGESSYAKNSTLQETVIQKALPFLKHAIMSIANPDVVFGQCFKIADLGCSSSKNTLLVASNIIDVVIDLYFYAQLEKKKGENFGPCFVSAVPGSFYGRLFPDQSLHLVHSANSVHWLSQVPEGLENNALNIYIAKTCPPNVFRAYEKQFHTDFTKFLRSRSEEIVYGGYMILTFVGRGNADPTSDDFGVFWELLAHSLQSMLKEGLVQESDINSFNLPIYAPCEYEVRDAIHSEGSFSLDNLSLFEVNWNPNDMDYTNIKDSRNEPIQSHGENTAKVVRAVAEPLLTSHFGNSIIDLVFKKYGEHVAEHLAKKKTRHTMLVVSLTKTTMKQ